MSRPLAIMPGKTYTPNGWTLPYKMVGGVKEFHLVAEAVEHEFAPGSTAKLWGYNGSAPGPTIEAVEGDRVRFYVTNLLPEPTSVHWHGLLLPFQYDGVPGISFPGIKPGETFLLGYDSEPIRAEKGLYDLSRWVLEHPALAAVLSADGVDAFAHEAPAGVDARAWGEWHQRFGQHR